MRAIGGFAPLSAAELTGRSVQPIGGLVRFPDSTMRTLIWTVMFLALTIACAMVGAAALIGHPIAGSVQFVLAAAGIALAGWGAALRQFE